jgi:15-cis-phytoene synthase
MTMTSRKELTMPRFNAIGPGVDDALNSNLDTSRPPMPRADSRRGLAGNDAHPVRRGSRQAPIDIDAAYDLCEHIARAQAPSHYHAIEPLPAYRRRALCAIYAFAHRVDDIANEDLHSAEKLWLLAKARADVPRDGTAQAGDPMLVAVRDVKRRFPLPIESLDDLIDGVERDIDEDTFDTFDDLVHYCRQVAGSIGRLTVAVLGSRDPATAARLADDLAVAIQLTIILRDLVEDAERGRVYLPSEEFALFGCPADPVAAPVEQLSKLIRYQARRNREWYDRGLRLLPLLDARAAAVIEAIVGIYTRILDRIERSPTDVLQGRSLLTGAEQARIAATTLAFSGGQSHVA